MTEFDEISENNFFVIDSYNLDDIEGKLYGYSIQNNNFITNDDLQKDLELSKNGAYVYVEVGENKITISQDFNGSYGLYIYQNEEYFAISNSFLKLVEHVKDNPISLNKDFADAYLFVDLCSFSYSETLINEISIIPRNCNVIVNKQTKKVEYEKIDYEEHSIYLNTEEGLDTLDKWYYKWVELIRSIRSKSNNLHFDLSGGIDSRVVAAIWLTAKINLNNIKINSAEKNFDEDYRIASQIAEKFNFELNRDLNISKTFINDLNAIISNSSYLKLGLHKQLYFTNFRFEENMYAFTGHNGESIRDYPNQTTEEYIDKLAKRCGKYSSDLIEPTKRLANRELKKLAEEYGISDVQGTQLPSRLYKEARNRHHAGKGAVETFFSNRITFPPLIDCDLHKLKLSTPDCNDKQLLVVMIFVRYCPQLLNFDIQGGRKFNPETIEYAKRINSIKPFKQKNYEFIQGPEINSAPLETTGKIISQKDIDDFYKGIFYSHKFKHEYTKHYSEKLYDVTKHKLEHRKKFKFREIYSAIDILKIMDIINSKNNLIDWLSSLEEKHYCEYQNYEISPKVLKLLLNYNTARIDIKNHGFEENKVEILEIDDLNAKVDTPDWFKTKDGIGTSIHSSTGNLKLKFKCIGDGKLKIKLRGKDVKDKSGNKFPVYIDFTKFIINKHVEFNAHTLLSHEDIYIFEKEVNDSDIIEVSLKWLPFNKKSEYHIDEDSDDESLKNSEKSLFNKIKSKI